jgi:hydroxyacylglutathione hydrolase
VLFSAGCGRIFEGTAEQMFDSLSKIAALPDETQVYCAHEYTASNVAFALAVEPDNEKLRQYRDDVNRLRALNIPTLPTTLRQEKWINPFLRTNNPEVVKSVTNRIKNDDPCSVFTALRVWKNEF